MNQFKIKPKIYFGADSLATINQLTGRQAFIISDQSMVNLGILDKLTRLLNNNHIAYSLYSDVTADADISSIVSGMQLMDKQYPDLVIALGGGSVIDAAKAIIYLLSQYRPATPEQPARPKPCFVAIPTTSGTGSEVTAFAVVKAKKTKWVMVDEFMLPDIAILDPALVASVPAAITADTGMDVLCHALEAYVSLQANDFTDALAEKCVKMVFKHLIDCYQNGADKLAREKMHNASCMAGMAFTNASLGITHSLAHALGGIFGLPHGRANALLMTQVVAFNADLAGACDNRAAQKYAALARMLELPSASQAEAVNSLITAINLLREELHIPASLAASGILEADFSAELDQLAELALNDSCTPTNPRQVNASELKTLYRQCFNAI